jgi:long-chain fatty acid transport protein
MEFAMKRYFSNSAVLLGATMCASMYVSTPAQAAGFSLLEQTGSGIGYAYAGAAASADDASAMFFNPAALSLLESPQVAVAAHAINLETKFQDRGSTLPPAGLGVLPAGATADNAGDLIPLPNAYLAWPLSDRLAVGFAINTPFGLKTDYVDPWIGRFHGLRSELTTLNANPALSWKLNDAVSLGVGLNYQHADAELTHAVMLGPATEGRAGIDVNDDAWGWNAGAIFTLPSATRVGVSYRSQLDFSLSGDTSVTTLAGQPVAAASGPTSVDITFPDSASLSVAHPIREGLEIRADASWMNWSKVGTIIAANSLNGTPRDVLHFGFEDTMRFALGLDYTRNERWSFRAGTAWDESPVKDDLRTVRLPDSDRWWLTAGARWRPTENLLVDAGYAHLFVRDTDVALTRAQTGGPASFSSSVVGEYDSSVDIVSLQVSWAFR